MHLRLGSASSSDLCCAAEAWASREIRGGEATASLGRPPPRPARARSWQASARAAETAVLAPAPLGGWKLPSPGLRCAAAGGAEWASAAEAMANPSQAAATAAPAPSEQRPPPPSISGNEQGPCSGSSLALPPAHAEDEPGTRQPRESVQQGRASPLEGLPFDPLSSDRAQGRSPVPGSRSAAWSVPADWRQGGAQAAPQDSRASAPSDGAWASQGAGGGARTEPGQRQDGGGAEAGGAGPGAARESGASAPLPPGLEAGRLPQHVAMILDGNSRWAQQRRLPKEMGHEAGVQALKRTVRLTGTWGIPALTVFAFSTENWKRPQAEVDFLMALLERLLNDDIAELHREGVVVRVMGDVARLAPSLQRKIQEARELTQANAGLKLTLAVNYSGRQDIVAACREVARQVAAGTLSPESIGEETLEAHLGTAWLGAQRSSPDLLIRTSGEQRLSNFLLWQAAYTELVFAPCLWPDFGADQYADCLLQFQRRDRRFGGRKAT